ncbi:MAG: serpin family protein [Candidatus Stygibacter frigidus]|nr:serpin family protein [Candidatus Stygibacter frigidus]
MNLKIWLLIALLIPSLIINAESLVNSINDFGFDLLRQIDAKENIVISPYSVFSALSMTADGADTETLIQMRNTLNLDKSLESSISLGGLQNMLKEKAEDKIELNIANAIWLDKKFTVKEAFVQNIEYNYQAKLNLSDFQKEANTLKEINKWVASQTKNKIPEILAELDPLSKLVLVNALYFNADWRHKFKKSRTYIDNFYLSAQDSVSVKMMNQTGKFLYYEDDQIQAVQLNYQGSNFSLLVILPRQSDNMPEILQNLNNEYLLHINAWEAGVKPVKISLPKYKIDFNRQLNDDLIELGMPLAFSSEADFSRINGKKDLCIGQVQHRGFIEVDEEGTEAAAATAVTMKLMSAAPLRDPVIFNADHPFIFLLQENTTNLILFAGIVNNPQ